MIGVAKPAELPLYVTVWAGALVVAVSPLATRTTRVLPAPTLKLEIVDEVAVPKASASFINKICALAPIAAAPSKATLRATDFVRMPRRRLVERRWDVYFMGWIFDVTTWGCERRGEERDFLNFIFN